MTNTRAKDMTGLRFGALQVESRDFSKSSRTAYWACLCDCGGRVSTQGASLRKGDTQSCGCLARKVTAERSSTHGLSKNPLYTVWQGMIARCQIPWKDNYKHYGARGIVVCERWQSVQNFIEDMGPGYSEGLTLERVDNEKGYSPENVRWASLAEQSRNRRNNVWLDSPLGILLLADALLLWTDAECKRFERVERG